MTRTERISLVSAGVVTAALIYVYPLFLPTPLLEPDEGLHATISQEMLEHGEWIVPRFLGESFADKPILYFWAQMISLKVFGMNEFAVRLPGLLFGLLGALTTGLLASRMFGARVGTTAWLMSMTMLIPLSLAQAAVHDVAVVPWTVLTLLSFWQAENAASRRVGWCWLAGAAVSMALAILTKALLGVVFSCIAWGLFIVFTRRLNVARCFRLAAALVVGMALASPWYIAMELRSSGYLYYYFVERHLLGFATSTQPHSDEAWHYYVPYIAIGALPWIWYLIPLLLDERKRRSVQAATSPQMVLILCWLLGGLAFLSVARSKLVTYSLPLFPAIAILSAVSWIRFAENGYSRSVRKCFLGITRILSVLGIAAPVVGLWICGRLTSSEWSAVCWCCGAAVSMLSVFSWVTFERGHWSRSAALCSIWVASLTAVVMTWPFQKFAAECSERGLARWINSRGELPDRLLVIGEAPASVIFYLKEELRRELVRSQFERLPTEEIPAGRVLRGGEVLAVTRKSSLKLGHLGLLRYPGAAGEAVGQFLVYERKSRLPAKVLKAFKSKSFVKLLTN